MALRLRPDDHRLLVNAAQVWRGVKQVHRSRGVQQIHQSAGVQPIHWSEVPLSQDGGGRGGKTGTRGTPVPEIPVSRGDGVLWRGGRGQAIAHAWRWGEGRC